MSRTGRAMTTIYVKNGTPAEAQSKCASCIHAHILRGFRESEELAYCTVPFGAPQVVPFKVYECSSYADRNRPTWKQMEELAIDILPLSSAKAAGFRAGKHSEQVEEDKEEWELETVSR
jgi:hypothetical protein